LTEKGSEHGLPGAPEAALKAVCRAAIKFGETLEMRKRADVALDSFIQLSGASGAALFLALEGERYLRVAGRGSGLKENRARSIELPGLAAELNRMTGPMAVSDLPRRGAGALAALRKELRELVVKWVVPLQAGGRSLGLICLAGEGPAASYAVSQSWVLSELAALTASALANAHSYEMAIFDEPTGLLATRYYHLRLREELRRAIRHSKELSLLLVRLDGLEAGWDSSPYHELRESSERIRDLIRADLDIPARYGENEFAVILPDTGLDGARVLAGRIQESLSGNGSSNGAGLRVSIGIASYPEHADTVEELSDCAERALMEAAVQGGIAVLPPSPRDAVDYRALRKETAPPVGAGAVGEGR